MISIIISAKNAARFIAETIESILKQSFGNWELLIFDDGSTDATLQIAQSLADPRIRIFSESVSKGLPERLNFLISEAKGELIARMDADDIMMFDRLAIQVAFLNEHPDVMVVGSYAECILEDGTTAGVRKVSGEAHSAFQLSFKNDFIIHPTIMARREFFEKNKYNGDLNRAEDYELWLRTFDQYLFRVIPKPLIQYRIYPTEYKKLVMSHRVGLKAMKLNKSKFSTFGYFAATSFFLFKLLYHSTIAKLQRSGATLTL